MGLTGLVAFKAPRRVLAVDPGMSGAVCLMGRDWLDVKRDFKKASDMVAAINSFSQAGVEEVWIELVSAMPGQGVCSMFNFGKATGVAIGALLHTFPGKDIIEVAPLKWQNHIREHLGMGPKDPFDSTAIATGLFPEHAWLFERKKDHNSADAVLIAFSALTGVERSVRAKKRRAKHLLREPLV